MIPMSTACPEKQLLVHIASNKDNFICDPSPLPPTPKRTMVPWYHVNRQRIISSDFPSRPVFRQSLISAIPCIVNFEEQCSLWS